MDRTAPAVFELGLLLLVAALAGRISRAVGLPAVIGYLLVGVVVSPFTPGYVANHEQLSILADVGRSRCGSFTARTPLRRRVFNNSVMRSCSRKR